MSVKQGNKLFNIGKYKEAILEYKKIKKNNPLFNFAKFNISLSENRIKEVKPFEEMSGGNEVESSPALSIIMPVFNVAPYLEASIISVLGQSFTDFEFIIVDDASTDDSPKIIDFFAAQDSRIKSFRLEHNTLGGAGIPSNIGIENAKGKWIGFVDSDDLVDRHAFREMIESAEDKDAEVVIGDFARFDQDYLSSSKSYDRDYWKDIPIDVVFNPLQASRVFRLSPVPWRKLYNHKFLKNNNIKYAEGDFFYEDNPLHWQVLSRANKVLMLDKVTSFHRMGREGQTMGANDWKFASVFMHINATRKFLKNYSETKNVHWIELLDQVYRSDWLYKNVKELPVKNLLRKLYAITCSEVMNDSGIKLLEMDKIRKGFEERYESNNLCRPDIDLTIIIPVYNASFFLDNIFSSLLKIKKIKFDVIFIDDGSTDDSISKCRDFANRSDVFCVFQQKNKGAGRARNAVLPLASGQYTYFFDADDVLIPSALEDSVLEAKAKKIDLYFMPYKLIKSSEKGDYLCDMFPTDLALWGEVENEFNPQKTNKFFAGMGNYPWNRIIKTKLIHENSVFFGGTQVHNDIQYHWHSICVADVIGFGNKEVCHHRIFEDRKQITNISDRRRLLVFLALENTYKVIKDSPSFDDLYNAWQKFSLQIINWAGGVIDSTLREEFEIRKHECLNVILKK